MVLPYLTPEERLLLAAKWRGGPEWYLSEFLPDPSGYFTRRDTGPVIFLGSSPGSNTRPDVQRPQDEPSRMEEAQSSEVNITDRSFLMPDDNDTSRQLLQDLEINELPPRTRVLSHFGILRLSNAWEFRFYVHKYDQAKLRRFLNCVQTKVGLSDGIVTAKKIMSIVADKARLKKLQDCYRRFHSNLNNTCLLCHHSPAGTQERMRTAAALAANAETSQRDLLLASGGGGHLLTGDFDFGPREVWNKALSHFREEFPVTMLAMVPHHGAKRNWRLELMSAMPNAGVWLVSASAHSRYHPHPQVIRDVIGQGRVVLWSNEYFGASVHQKAAPEELSRAEIEISQPSNRFMP